MPRGKRVEIVKIMINGVEVDAKACTKCGEVKALTEFHGHKGKPGGRMSRCRECTRRPGAKRIKPPTMWTTDTYSAYVREVTGGEYDFIDTYTSSQMKSLHVHHKCGRSYRVRPNDFINGIRCSPCFRKTRKSTEVFKEELRKVLGNCYMVLGEYEGDAKPVRILHTECGSEYETTPSNILQGSRCAVCYRNRKKTTEEFRADVACRTGGEYTVLGEYINSNTPIKMWHAKCKSEYTVRPNDFLSKGYRCPNCSESRGEKKIREWLRKKYLSFKAQDKFIGCRDKHALRFDFIIRKEKLVVAVEYDGVQHSRPVDFAGKGEEWALEQFRETQRRDRIKTDYCRANGIPLIRIDYTQFDEIEEILTRELTELGVLSSETGNRSIDESDAA